MNRTIILVPALLVTCLLVAKPAQAQPETTLTEHHYSISASYAMPVTPSLELSYWVLPQLSLGAEYAVHLFPPLFNDSDTGLDLLAQRISATARYGLALGNVELYGKLKAGVLVTSGTLNGDEDTRFVFSPLAGALYRFTPALALFAEGGAMIDPFAPERSTFGTVSPELSLGLQARF